MRNLFLGLVIVLGVAGCATHKLTPAGKGVLRAYSLTDVKGCKLIGEVEAVMSQSESTLQILGAVAGAPPPAGKNHRRIKEMTIDARNKAAALGGNRIVPVSEDYGNAKEYNVYLCES